MNKIPIDFVAGTHGNFLEVILNKGFGFTPDFTNPFTPLGTSHNKSKSYHQNKVFEADHWSERRNLIGVEKIISITFSQQDLLLVASVSLARAGDMALHNNDLEINTVEKLNNDYYKDTLQNLLQSYPDVDISCGNIPRNILREFYKFGFKDPNINGYWLKLQQLKYQSDQQICYVNFQDFYDESKFVQMLKRIELFVGLPFVLDSTTVDLHTQFLLKNSYRNHQQQCDAVVAAVQQAQHIDLPKLTLFQESYINAVLENIYGKEMPFHDQNYFTSTKDVLNYIETQAPLL